jgi:hypothetical protein
MDRTIVLRRSVFHNVRWVNYQKLAKNTFPSLLSIAQAQPCHMQKYKPTFPIPANEPLPQKENSKRSNPKSQPQESKAEETHNAKPETKERGWRLCRARTMIKPISQTTIAGPFSTGSSAREHLLATTAGVERRCLRRAIDGAGRVRGTTGG